MNERALEAYLIFAIFLASGISFLGGAFPRVVVRIVVGVVGLASALALTGGILFAIGFSAGFGARSFGPDGPMMLGAALIVVYFIACAFSSLPFLPQRHIRVFGLSLHFIFMPIAVCLLSMTRAELSFDIRLYNFVHELSLGLIYAMLWFRMADKEYLDHPDAKADI